MTQDRIRSTRNIFLALLFLVGMALVATALAAETLGVNITPGFGMVQMFQMLVGVTLLTVASFIYLRVRRGRKNVESLQADIGMRLAATGLIFCYVAGLSDLLGIGTHSKPEFARPFVGPLQLGGLAIGALVIDYRRIGPLREQPRRARPPPYILAHPYLQS